MQLKTDPATGVIDAGVDGIGFSAPWLQAKLAELRVTLAPDSEFAVALRQVRAMRVAVDQPRRFADELELYRWYLRGSGADFLSKALHAGDVCGLRGFNSHFAALRGGDPVLTSPAKGQSTDRDRTWELLLASLAATFSDHVDPDEPDLVCDFQGKRVGVAAKILYTENQGRHIDPIKKGAKQLDRSNADYGFVLVNAAQLFPHEAMFANFRDSGVRTNDEAARIVGVWADSFVEGYGAKQWLKRLKDTKKLYSVMFFVPTVVYMPDAPNPYVPYYRLHVVARRGDAKLLAKPFEYRLNWALQWVLSFRGKPGSYPSDLLAEEDA